MYKVLALLMETSIQAFAGEARITIDQGLMVEFEAGPAFQEACSQRAMFSVTCSASTPTSGMTSEPKAVFQSAFYRGSAQPVSMIGHDGQQSGGMAITLIDTIDITQPMGSFFHFVDDCHLNVHLSLKGGKTVHTISIPGNINRRHNVDEIVSRGIVPALGNRSQRRRTRT